ncbi:hypothetical protein ACWD0J_05390 [Streptomyces sp. NPDC003011]
MFSIIVVPPPTTEDDPNRVRRRLAPGERPAFGRSARDLPAIDVWAPRHDCLRTEGGPDGDTTAPAFPVDRGKRCFAVPAALCEPRPRGAPHAPPPTADQAVGRLRRNWPAASRTSVRRNTDHPAVKLRLKRGPESAGTGVRLHGTKESPVPLAPRFDLVREEDPAVLAAPAARGAR